MDRDAWALAARQRWLVTAAQLRALGFSDAAIRHRVNKRRLWPVHPGVFAVGHPELTQERAALAAALACGEGAAVARLWATSVWGVWEHDLPIRPQVVVPTHAGRPGPHGIELHRSTTLLETDVTEFDGIPVTSLERTICDCAGLLDRRRLTALIRQAQRVHRLELHHLRAYLEERSPCSFRHARVRRVLDDYLPAAALTSTEREARFYELCAHHGIPRPEPQFPIGRYKADFAWPELYLVVELDDRGSHEGDIAFAEDRRRDRAMKAAGFDVLRFALVELRRGPAAVAAEVKAAVACATRSRTSRRTGPPRRSPRPSPRARTG